MSVMIENEQSYLVQLLLKHGILQPEDAHRIIEYLSRHGDSVEDALIQSGRVTEQQIAEAYSREFDLPLIVSEENLCLDLTWAELMGEQVCREHGFVPIQRDRDSLVVAFANPANLASLERVQLASGLLVRPVVVYISMVDRLLDQAFGSRDIVKEIASEVQHDYSLMHPKDEDQEIEEVLNLDQPVPKGKDSHVIRLVNHVLLKAVEEGASDIHVEPFEDNFKIRFRQDGQMFAISPSPRSMYVPMISRLKILAKMDIAERRIPQDGAMALKLGDKRVDLRVNTVPTVYGEKMVMRILSKNAIPEDLTQLGFSAQQAQDFREAAESPHGLLFVTGPTGSGKSTTLYAILNLLNKPNVNVMTIEDPVEYKFEGLNQVHVRTQVGLTFASALRAFLRQDPDIIMVGEVRDTETAQICLRAALTGHMVLSTLHTNSALAAVNRLVDMGAERFLLASALRLVEAQRLVRRLCKHCKEPYDLEREVAEQWHLDVDRTYYRPKGCPICRGSGYHGRVGLFEVIPIHAKLQDMISEGVALPLLCEEARRHEHPLLLDAGLDKVADGVTSLEEIITTCGEQADDKDALIVPGQDIVQPPSSLIGEVQ